MWLKLRHILKKITKGNARKFTVSFAFCAHVDVIKIEKHWCFPLSFRHQRACNDKTRALIRRAMKRAGPSKKVWCRRLGLLKRGDSTYLQSNFDFFKKIRETPFYLNQQLFCSEAFAKRWVFLGWKQDFKFRAVNEEDLLALVVRVSFWLMNKVYARKLSFLVLS